MMRSTCNDFDTPIDYFSNPICTMVCWKKRSGWASYSTSSRAWERRLVVVAQSKLVYYAIGEMDTTKSRATLDLVENQASCTVAKPSTDAPSNFELEVKAVSTRWRFCFDTQEEQMQLLQAIHQVLEVGGCMDGPDADRFEHQFVAGDHIYRWELIIAPPIIYPIQIHGIVLEAGRNCVIVVDFGLTGYSKREGARFNHAEDHEAQRTIQLAWKKLRPTGEDQRLCISTLTSPKEIAKWTKANYGEFFSKSSHFNFSKLTKYMKKKSRLSSRDEHSIRSSTDYFQSESMRRDESMLGSFDDDMSQSSFFDNQSPMKTPKSRRKLFGTDQQQKQSRRRTFSAESSSNRLRLNSSDSGASTPRSVKEATASEPQQTQPKSDPVKIVLARCHYLLEVGEEVLPPYHVFFSNSECIAVWCKTGRWSTFQTAVFLSSNSVGAAKSATLATITVAVANPLLAPLMAVGGLVWVGTPMVILAKSREKWEEATNKLTDLFWAWAPNEIYVEAIRAWSGI